MNRLILSLGAFCAIYLVYAFGGPVFAGPSQKPEHARATVSRDTFHTEIDHKSLKAALAQRSLSVTDVKGSVLEFQDLDVRMENGVHIISANSADSRITLVYDGLHAFGHIVSNGNEYLVDTVGGQVRLITSDMLPTEPTVEMKSASSDVVIDEERTKRLLEASRENLRLAQEAKKKRLDATVSEQAAETNVATEHTVVDIAFFYDQELDLEFGPQFSRTLAEASVAFTNAAYALHNVPLELRAVFVGPLAEQSIGDPFNQFVGSDSAYYTGEEYGADLIHRLFRYTPDLGINYCGKAFLAGRQGVSGIGCSISVPTVVAHEVGHNFGANHDRANARNNISGLPVSEYNYGFICGNQGTTMAYFSPRVPHYSSPLISNGGEPCGVSPGLFGAADNARVMDVMRDTIANFRNEQEIYGSLILTYAGPQDVAETDTPLLTFSITRGGDVSRPVSVETAIIDFDTTAGQDYSDVIQRIEFGPGETEKSFQLQILDDSEYEEFPETLQVHLRYPKGATVDSAPIDISISSDDPDLGEARVVFEGSAVWESAGTHVVELVRQRTTDGELSIRFQTADGSAVAGVDYEATSGTVTFADGETTQFIPVVINDDDLFQGLNTYRTFVVDLVGDNVTSPSRHTVFIWNDDFESGRPIFATGTAAVDEAARRLKVQIERVDGTEGPLTFQYQTISGTATAGVDFVGAEGGIAWSDGETSSSIDIGLIDNERFDGDRSFVVRLYGGDLGTTVEQSFTIINDDPNRGLARFSSDTASAAEGAGLLRLQVGRVDGSEGELKVSYTTLDRTARAGENYVQTAGELIFGPGESTKNIDVPLIDNDQRDATRFFKVQIVGQLVADPDIATVTIIDDDVDNAAVGDGENRGPLSKNEQTDKSGGGGAIGFAFILFLICSAYRRFACIARHATPRRNVLRLGQSINCTWPMLLLVVVAAGVAKPSFAQAPPQCETSFCKHYTRTIDFANDLDIVQPDWTLTRGIRDVDGELTFTIPKFDVENATLEALVSTVRLDMSGTAECFSPYNWGNGCGVAARSFSVALDELNWEDTDPPGGSLARDYFNVSDLESSFARPGPVNFTNSLTAKVHRTHTRERFLGQFLIQGPEDTTIVPITFKPNTTWQVGNAANSDGWFFYDIDIPVSLSFSKFEFTADIWYVYMPDNATGRVDGELLVVDNFAPVSQVTMVTNSLSVAESTPFIPEPSVRVQTTINNGLEENILPRETVSFVQSTYSSLTNFPVSPESWEDNPDVTIFWSDECEYDEKPGLGNSASGERVHNFQTVSVTAEELLLGFQSRVSSCHVNYRWRWLEKYNDLSVPKSIATGFLGDGFDFIVNSYKDKIAKFFKRVGSLGYIVTLSELANQIGVDNLYRLDARTLYRLDVSYGQAYETVFEDSHDYLVVASGDQERDLLTSIGYDMVASEIYVPILAACVIVPSSCPDLMRAYRELLYLSESHWNRSRTPWYEPPPSALTASGMNNGVYSSLNSGGQLPVQYQSAGLSGTDNAELQEVFLTLLELASYGASHSRSVDKYLEARALSDMDAAAIFAGDAISFNEQFVRAAENIAGRGGLGVLDLIERAAGTEVVAFLATSGIPQEWYQGVDGFDPQFVSELEQFTQQELTAQDFDAGDFFSIGSEFFLFLAEAALSANASIGSEVTPVLPPKLQMPSFVGMVDSDALAVIGEMGFGLGPVIQVSSRTVPSGEVMAQNIDAGQLVPLHAFVSLTISSGLPVVDVPKLVALNEVEATQAINAANLSLASVQRVSDSSVPAGVVISQDPIAGTRVDEGTSVHLVVSSGPQMVGVPDLVGLTEEDAINAIGAANLSVGNIQRQQSNTVPAGQVISHQPTAGTQVAQGSSVSLVVSLGSAGGGPGGGSSGGSGGGGGVLDIFLATLLFVASVLRKAVGVGSAIFRRDSRRTGRGTPQSSVTRGRNSIQEIRLMLTVE